MSFEPALLSAMTALVAVVVSPIVSLYIAKRQINTTVISKNRQEWINQLRSEITKLLKLAIHTPSAYSSDALVLKEAILKHGELLEKVNLVKLLINPKESDHIELVRLIDSINELVIRSIEHKKGNAKDIEGLAQAIVSQSQQIFKREWERVKSGK